jgi:fructokinase
MKSEDGKFVLVGLGEILWDMLPEGKQLGGAPTNFAYHAQALGGKGYVVSCVGNDEPGGEILSVVEGIGLDKQYIAVDENHPTGTVTIELDNEGKPNYVIHENVAWDFIPSNWGLMELAAKTDCVCFGSLCQRSEVSRETVRNFLGATNERCLRIFDINLRQKFYSREIIDSMLGISNVLKLNDEELPVVTEMLGIEGDQTKVLSRLAARYGLRLIALTKGAEGSRLYTDEEDFHCEGIAPGKIADTVGAGDSFTAAIAMGLLRGDGLEEINNFANRLASFVCTQNGATPRLPEDLIKK